MREKRGIKLNTSELIEEARLQTGAIQRLKVWMRLAYSLVAVGFILGLWGSQQGSTPAIVAGVACLVVGTPFSIVLKVGVTRATRNVERILEAAGVDVDELFQRTQNDDPSTR